MDATPHSPNPISTPTAAPQNGTPHENSAQADDLNADTINLDAINAALDTSPLAGPMRRLAGDLDALVHSGDLLGIELDLAHADCPCFLLSVAEDAPQFYVELFLDESLSDDPEEASLCVLMNWMGRDTEPASWQVDLGGTEPGGTDTAAPETDFGELLVRILLMTDTR